MSSEVVIDGSIGEGGGQVLRTSLALAALLGQPVALHNIRVGRKRPGLRPQHLTAVQALAQITGAEVVGAAKNATSLTFTPQAVRAGSYHFRIGTAGSVTLLIAAILPPLLFAPQASLVVVEGGTHVPFSPVYHYMNEVFLPGLRRMGAAVTASLDRWGWYPKGGGRCTLHISPCQGLKARHLAERGRLGKLSLVLGLAGLPLHIVEREEAHVGNRLHGAGYVFERRFEAAPSPGQGNVLFLKGEYDHGEVGFSALGRRGRPAEQVAEDLCRQWLDFVGGSGTVDKHLADQLLLYMALAKGKSLVKTEEVTRHLLTNIDIIEKFLPVHFKVNQGDHLISVTGSAYQAPAPGGQR